MPLPKKGESKDDYLQRCMGDPEMDTYPQDQRYAVCQSKWSEHKMRIMFAKISIDYDGVLSTDAGKELAKRLIAEGNDLYIISARQDKEGMLSVADSLGIPASKVYATGSNKAKVEKVNQLGITKHYDNNPDVISQLPKIGKKVFDNEGKTVFDL